MPRFDYESPASEWWREWSGYVWGVAIVGALIGLAVWGISAANRDLAECLALRRRCEMGEMDACVACQPCGGKMGDACESQLRAAALRRDGR